MVQRDVMLFTHTFYSGTTLQKAWKILYSDKFDGYYTKQWNIGQVENNSSELAQNEDGLWSEKRILTIYPDIGLLGKYLLVYIDKKKINYTTEQVKTLYVDDYRVSYMCDNTNKALQFKGYLLDFVIKVPYFTFIECTGKIFLCPATPEEVEAYKKTELWRSTLESLSPEIRDNIPLDKFCTMTTILDVTTNFWVIAKKAGIHYLFIENVRKALDDVFGKMCSSVHRFATEFPELVNGNDEIENRMNNETVNVHHQSRNLFLSDNSLVLTPDTIDPRLIVQEMKRIPEDELAVYTSALGPTETFSQDTIDSLFS